MLLLVLFCKKRLRAAGKRRDRMRDKEWGLKCIEEKKDLLFSLSDQIWENPEIKYQEHFAAEEFCRVLEAEGFQVERNLAGIPTAFSGSFGKGKPVIGILAEYDALPGLSQKAGLTEKCPKEEGAPGHGCGHNLLGTGALAAAIGIKAYLEKTGKPGQVKLMGCPAEEGGAGKGFLARDGAFDDLDAAFCWHPGEVNSAASERTTANCQILYKFRGVSSHAGMSPELGRSALDAVELMNTGVQYLREHIPSDNRIHYAITNAGGTSPGIVQAYAEVLYLMRAPKAEAVKSLFERVNKIARGAALMTETEMEAVFIKATSDTIINMELLKVMQSNLESIPLPSYDQQELAYAEAVRETCQGNPSYFDLLLADVEDEAERARLLQNSATPLHNVVFPLPKERQGFASSDVGDVSSVCPVGQINGCTLPSGCAMHSWQMTAVGKSSFAKKGMLYAGMVMAGSGIDLIERPDLLDKAKREFTEKTGGKPFVSPIPKEVNPCW